MNISLHILPSYINTPYTALVINFTLYMCFTLIWTIIVSKNTNCYHRALTLEYVVQTTKNEDHEDHEKCS